MSYRPQIKNDANGAVTDLPLDAETVKGSDIVDSSGMIKSTKIPDLDASKITSGTIAPERLDIAKNLNLINYYSRIKETGIDSNNNTIVPNSGTYTIDYFSVLPSTTYSYNFANVSRTYVFFYDSNKNLIDYGLATDGSFTTPNNCYYLRLQMNNSITQPMFNVGSSALAYMPYINEASKIIGSNGFTTISGVSDLINALNGDIGKMVQFMLIDRDLTDDTVILFPSIILPKYPLVSGYLSGIDYMSVAGGTIAMQGRLYYYELEFNISYNSNNELSVNSVIIYRAYNSGDIVQLTNGLIGYYIIS